MPKMLSSEAVQQYHRDGYYFPVPVLSREEAAHYRRCLEQHEAKTGKPLQGNWRHKTHLIFTWADELAHHPKILDAVEDVIGPDILCWTTNFFIKEASNPGFVSWHQDSTYWGLDPDDVITAWVAFTDATPENGYMQFMPGSHKVEQLPHVDTFHKDNLLSRGQEIAVEVDKSKAVGIPLRAGKCRCITSSWCTAPNPTAPTTGASAWRSATSPPTCARPRCATRRCWCAAPTNIITSTTNRARARTWMKRRSPPTPTRSRAR